MTQLRPANAANFVRLRRVAGSSDSKPKKVAMTNLIKYRQCTLRKICRGDSSVVTVSYIPARFAQLERTLKLRQADCSWDNGWQVEHVGASLTESELPDTHAAVRRHRQTAGDSLCR